MTHPTNPTQHQRARRQLMSFTVANLGLLALSPVHAAICNPKSNPVPRMDIFYKSAVRKSQAFATCSDIKSSTAQDIAGYDGNSLTAYAGTLHTHTMNNGKIVQVWARASKATLTKVKGQPLKANYFDAQDKLQLSLTKDQLSNPLTHDKPWSDKDDDGLLRKRSLEDVPNSNQDWTAEQVRVRRGAAFRQVIADWFERLNRAGRLRQVPVDINRPSSTPQYSPLRNNANDINIHWNTLNTLAIAGNEPPYSFTVDFSVNPNPDHSIESMRGRTPFVYTLNMVRDFTAPSIMRYYVLVTISENGGLIDAVMGEIYEAFFIRNPEVSVFFNFNEYYNFRRIVREFNQRINTAIAGGGHTAIAETLFAGAEHALATQIIPPSAPLFSRMPFNWINALMGCRRMQDVVVNDPLPPYYFPPEIWRIFLEGSAQMDLIGPMRELLNEINRLINGGWPWYTFTFDDSNEDHRRLIGYSHDVPPPKPSPKPGPKPGPCRGCKPGTDDIWGPDAPKP